MKRTCKKNNLFVIFDSHSRGGNGLSAVLVSFSCLDDLISYIYAFYDSMRIDMSLQFDFLPVTVKNMITNKTIRARNLKQIG